MAAERDPYYEPLETVPGERSVPLHRRRTSWIWTIAAVALLAALIGFFGWGDEAEAPAATGTAPAVTAPARP